MEIVAFIGNFVKNMPTIKIIDSIKIDIYSREHPPPHVHVLYSGYEILIEIKTLKIYAGQLPKTQYNKAFNWIKENSNLLLENFKRLNPKL